MSQRVATVAPGAPDRPNTGQPHGRTATPRRRGRRGEPVRYDHAPRGRSHLMCGGDGGNKLGARSHAKARALATRGHDASPERSGPWKCPNPRAGEKQREIGPSDSVRISTPCSWSDGTFGSGGGMPAPRPSRRTPRSAKLSSQCARSRSPIGRPQDHKPRGPSLVSGGGWASVAADRTPRQRSADHDGPWGVFSDADVMSALLEPDAASNP